MRMFPTRSVTNMRPSGAKARSHGTSSPVRTTVAASRGTVPAASGTVIARKTPLIFHPGGPVDHRPKVEGVRAGRLGPSYLEGERGSRAGRDARFRLRRDAVRRQPVHAER